MIITAQPFFNELDLLEIKCRELEGVVDLHVVVEARRTFTGLVKPLFFSDNKARFERFPILHKVVDLPDVADSPWEREQFQYECVREEVRRLQPSIAMFLDTDECPRKDVVGRFKEMGIPVATLEMDQLLFSFDRMDSTCKWTNGKICHYEPSMTIWRGFEAPILPDAGWHFEYFGGREVLMQKLNAFSHAPEEGVRNMRKLLENGELPGWERTIPYPKEKLPECLKVSFTRE